MTQSTFAPATTNLAEFADWRASMEMMLDADLSNSSVDHVLSLARDRILALQPAAAAETTFDAANLEVAMLQNLIETVTGHNGSTSLH